MYSRHVDSFTTSGRDYRQKLKHVALYEVLRKNNNKHTNKQTTSKKQTKQNKTRKNKQTNKQNKIKHTNKHTKDKQIMILNNLIN